MENKIRDNINYLSNALKRQKTEKEKAGDPFLKGLYSGAINVLELEIDWLKKLIGEAK